MALMLYDHPLSPYGQKVKIALLEKKVPFDAPLPQNIGSGERSGEFAKASPRGEVPALIDGEISVFDSTVILEYIEDKWPNPPLLPKAPADRARVRMIEDAMDTHYEAINWGLGELQFFGRGAGTVADAIRTKAGAQIASWHKWLERQLGDREWFNGTSFGWGDLSVVPYINGSRGFGLNPPKGSRLSAWLDRANARPSVVEVSKAAASMSMQGASAGMQAVRELLEKGLFKREYRDHRLEWMVKSGGITVVEDGLKKNNIRFIDPFSS